MQFLLTVVFGPIGVLYTSSIVSFFLTGSTLAAIFYWPDKNRVIIGVSYITAAVIGYLLVIQHNRKTRIRNFNVSSYHGRVSCRVTDQVIIKRNYDKPLAKARRNKSLHDFAVWSVSCLSGVSCALVAFPEMLGVFNQSGRSEKRVVASSEPQFRRALPETDAWKITADRDNEFSALLSADSYQDSSVGLYKPKLSVSCASNKTAVTFVTKEVLGTQATNVSVGFNHNGMSKVNWQAFGDYQSASVSFPISFVKQIKTSSTLQINYLPFGQTTVKAANFELSGSETVISKVRQLCHW
ncbi:hypothetical protein AB833_16430 [Chromatiales bacterium (ex Bugula neritina AB1)]|nr:hypothetical protein AB833_16430 [Chromatiales bacterium (ex Bugula neritina AB1)]